MYKYSENNRVLSRRLKLSVLSVRSRRSSLSEFQAVGPTTANARADPIQAETVSRHNEVMTPGRTKMSSTGYIRDHDAVVHQVPGSLMMKAVMHHQHELELHSGTDGSLSYH